MKLLTPTLKFEMTIEEATQLFHICTFISHETSVSQVMKEEARQLASVLASFDVNKLGDKTK